MGYDFKKLKQDNDIVSVIKHYVSLKKKGTEYVGICPFHDDKHESLQVNPHKQIFGCFACGTNGDVIDFLLAYGKDYKDINKELSGGTIDANGKPKRVKTPKEPQQRVQWIQQPATSEPKEIRHHTFGTPSRTWQYHTSEGQLLGYICRFDTPEGKQVLPFIYATDGKRSEWRWQGFDKPRPLYRLHEILANPDKSVIIVEGEKTADAVQERISTGIVTTWQGGARAFQNTDWSPLAWRKLLLWPDNDKPGIEAMTAIAEINRPTAALIKHIHNPIDAPEHWDAADTDWDQEHMRQYVLENLHDEPQPVYLKHVEEEQQQPTAPEAQEAPGDEMPPEVKERKIHELSSSVNPHFQFLGFINDGSKPVHCFYAKGKSKTVIRLSAASMKVNSLIDLAPPSFWEGHFPSENKDKIDMKAAIQWITGISASIGHFNSDRIRGRGAWDDDGRTVVHCGDHLIVDGAHTTLDQFKSRFIYEMSEELDVKTSEPLKATESAQLLEMLKLMRWEREVDPYLLAGWCVIAPICGVLKWRPHIWLTGAAGTGKTWLFSNIVRKLLGSVGLNVQSETTEAGLRQMLGHDALPIIFDEAEAEDRRAQERIQNTLNLMRAASAYDGGVMIKGSAAGTAVTYRIRSCFAFASIGLALAQQADRSRVTIIGLRAWQAHQQEQQRAQFDALLKKYNETMVDGFVDRLHARTISLVQTIIKNAKVFSTAAASVIGTQRTGDQLGALLAGVYSLHSAKEITYDEAREWVAQRDWSEEKGLDSTKDEIALFNHLMEQIIMIEGTHSKMERNIGELVMIAVLKKEDPLVSYKDAQERLLRFGFKIDSDDYLVISNSADAIKKMLSNTAWSKNHNKILMRINGARAYESTRFGSGVSSRAIGVPIHLLLEAE